MTVWPVKTLGEVCEVARGTSITRKETKEGMIPVIAGGIDVAYFHSVQNRPAGTITVSSSGANAGFVNRWDVPIFASDCSTVVAKEGGMVFGDYAFRFLQFKQSFINAELRRGAAQPHVYAKDIAAIEISVPPLEEQKRIVALLDAATARVTELTACYEQARTHANDLFTSALCDALESNPEWSVKTLGEVCELVSRGRPPSYCEVGGVIVLNQKCVRNGQIDFGPSRRTDSSVKAIPEWAYLREGDTLVNSTGAGTLGRASFVSFLTEPTTFDTHLTVVRPLRDACWPAFVGLVLNGREKDIVDLAGGATGQTELPREAVRSFEIPVPPLEDQKRIVARLDLMRAKTSEMVAAYDAKLTAAKNLRQSILEAAFGGAL